MLLAVLSSGPHLYEWEMEFTCIISQRLGLAAPYLLLVHTFFGGGGWYIWMREGWEFSVCECTHKNLTYTRSSQISSIIYHPLSIPSAPMPHSLPLQPPFLRPPWSLQCSCPMRRLLFALLQNKCMRLAVVFIHLMSDWCIACPLSQIQEGISLPRGN